MGAGRDFIYICLLPGKNTPHLLPLDSPSSSPFSSLSFQTLFRIATMDFIFGFFKTINAIKVKKAVDMVAVFVQIIEFDEFSAKIRLFNRKF